VSLTQAENVFAGVHESGLNDLLRAVFTARPRYLNYGTPFFVPVDTVSATAIAPINFPGVQGGIQLAVSMSMPEVDIHPDSHGGSWKIPPTEGSFALKTTLKLTFLCGPDRRGRSSDRHEERGFSTTFELYALCRPFVMSSAPGSGEIGIAVDAVELVDIKPEEFESMIECLVLAMVRAMFSNVLFPFKAITMGAFGLILLVGPDAETDQITVRGNAL